MILPPYGLSGGSMRFDPGSLVLFVDDSLESIRAFLAEPDDASRTQPLQIRSRLVHERDHLFRHLSSSYGMVRYGLHSLMVRQFFQMVMRVDFQQPTTSDGVLGPDLKELLRKHPPPEVIHKLSRHEAARPSLMYLAMLECVLALDGDRAFLDRDLCATGVAVWETLSLSLTNRAGQGLAYYQQNLAPPEPLSRFVNPNDPFVPWVKGHPLGAAHLLEFFGILIEFAYLSNQGLDVIESSDLLGVNEYFRVGSAFFDEFFVEEMEAGAFPAFPVELEAAVDLALAMPLTPTGLIVVNRPLSWYDLHPGWRFLAVCQHFKSSKKSWTTVAPDAESFAGYDHVFRSIQADVCDALGWPRVESVEHVWSTFLADVQREPVHHPLPVDLRGSGRQRIARHLFDERRTTPYSMFLKRRSGAVDRELFFPAVVSREGMTAFGGLHWNDSDGDPTNWDEFLLLTGCRFFAEGFPQHPHVRFEQARGAAEWISRCSAIFGADQDRVETVLARLLTLESYQKFEAAMASMP